MRRSIVHLLVIVLAAAPFASSALDLESLLKHKDKFKELKKVVFGFKDSEMIQIGDDAAAKLFGAAPLVNDPALQSYVNRLGRWLALHSSKPNLPWSFGVLEDNEINAFALPGGRILVTRGLLMRCRDESELAGVLAHEISHVSEKHHEPALRKDKGFNVLSEAYKEREKEKGRENRAKIGNAVVEAVFIRGFDRDQEFAADRHGVVIAARAGYDPYGLASFLQTLSSINPQDNVIKLMKSTHPEPKDRLNKLMQAMDGRMDQFAQQPKLPERYSLVMKTHLETVGK